MTPQSWDNPVDTAVMRFVVEHRSDGATMLAKAVMWVGTTPAALAAGVLIAAVAVMALRAWRPATAAGGALVAAAVVAAVLKAVFQRPRPPADLALVATGGFSFPSTQAMETAAITVALLLSAPLAIGVLAGSATAQRVLAAVLVGATVLVGACMVYLGAHWPTDVVAGWLLGSVIGGVAAWTVQNRRPTRGWRPGAPSRPGRAGPRRGRRTRTR